ncbi:hypothetical protein KP509_29G080500 [Ceratopteris richardii]|uniref:Uncharacterized protein n=1 Tax=Ceratopteris richardii TaxID=49495 RepID=A0A8T2R8D6_CERRI|nr:hypothetical protein KP509_29G080500 [Ceratopteris richardii]
MMGKGADGGCSRNGCNGTSSVGMLSNSKGLFQSGSLSRMKNNIGQKRGHVDLISQALKALAVKPAFGELGTGISSGSLSTPIANDNRRKQRIKKNEVNGMLLKDYAENNWCRDMGPFWSRMEEYFREPTAQDIQLLALRTRIDMSNVCGSLDPLLRLPVLPSENASQTVTESSEMLERASSLQQAQVHAVCENLQNQSASGQIDDTRHAQVHMVCQTLQNQSTCGETGDSGHEQHQIPHKRKLLGSSSANKRRKLMSSSSDSVTAVISPPENGDKELCHVCYEGDSDHSNQIIFCDSCNVAVHQECYGVKVVPDGQWLCSLCSYRNSLPVDAAARNLYDCAFCPVKGGALKAIGSHSESVREPATPLFGHLFCCQWIPETYIGDLDVMEPITNVEGVREERWKLLCSICRQKHGACIQCSHGFCATAFHPLCAREAKLRMEASSKANGDQIDLRAFCSRHTIMIDKPSMNNIQADCEGGHEMVGINIPKSCLSKDSEKVKLATDLHVDVSMMTGGLDDNAMLLLKKANMLNGESTVKIINGLLEKSDNCPLDHMHCLKKNGKIPLDNGEADHIQYCMANPLETDDQAIAELGKSSTGCFDDKKREEKADHNSIESSCIQCFSKRRKLEQQSHPFLLPGEDVQVPVSDISERESQVESKGVECGSQVQSLNQYLECVEQVNNDEERRLRGLKGEASTSQESPFVAQRTVHILNQTNAQKVPSSLFEGKLFRSDSGAEAHPFVIMRLLQVQRDMLLADSDVETESITESPLVLDVVSSQVDKQRSKVPRGKSLQPQNFIKKRGLALRSAKNTVGESIEAQLKQLEQAKKLGILDMALESELEEEIVALQMNLVSQALGNNQRCEKLVLKVIPTLSKELRVATTRTKDLAVVSQYMTMVREAKKQGRKERKSKEAQAVLAAATAVAAASPRLGAFRKDVPGSHVNDEPCPISRDSFSIPKLTALQSCVVNNTTRPSLTKTTSYAWTSSSQTSSCGKANSFDLDLKSFDSKNHNIEMNSVESKEERILCDICKDPSVLDPVITCHRCKVFIHQQCYGANLCMLNDWHCQPCTEIVYNSQDFRPIDVIDRATPGYDIFCSLCFGQTGAFKRFNDGKWAHIFCVQWFPGFSEKGQVGPPESMLASVDKMECSICHMKLGARLRCSFGHCHGTFHPLCARDSGLYMSVKRVAGGRIQHRAYCEKHSTQQRQKAASRKYGSSDELNALLQIRAELERVRILCERVCKRERLKRDKFLCNLDVYAAHLSSLSSSAMVLNDLSSTSNTFGMSKGFRKVSALHTEQNDIIPARFHGVESESLSWNSGEGNKCQDSLSGDSVYQVQMSSEPSRETPGRSHLCGAPPFQYRGKLNMYLGAVGKEQRRFGNDQRGLYLQAEPLKTEMIMTPTEASVQNQRLPKGYAYVPVGAIPKAKLNYNEASLVKDI